MHPELIAQGSMDETAVIISQSFAAWWEHEGVLNLLCMALMLAAVEDDVMDGLAGVLWCPH